ncbi:MAG TPA: two-component regulator propeller domain-containing protein [Candidatus Paceibacterota bacterium]|nr:two-component regulator propeller domain-containing protein [Verrucomicrobiota bacterium]HSA11378.1 two-component regulator propeller domain-containing protein [Candidatus Paceibacterota bacterium]
MNLTRPALTWIVVIGAVSLPLLSAAAAPARREEPPPPPVRAPADAGAEFVISFWRTGEGLPVNDVRDLAETPDGYLWLGTHHGLVRFDGARFETFLRTPTGQRYGTRVGPLEIDGQGRLWLAPDEVGLIRLDSSGFSELLTNGAFLRNRAESLCSDGTNTILWVDDEGGLGQVSTEPPNKASHLAGPASGASRWVRDYAGQLWLASPLSLQLYQAGQWRDAAVPGSASMVVAPRRAGGLWVAREAKLRFVRADGSRGEVTDFPWRGQSRVTCMREDRRGRLWIGTVSQGLYCYAASEFSHVMPTASSIACLLEDRQDNIWVGTRGGGLARVRQRQFFVCDLRSGMRNEFVRSLAQDRAGRMWIVTTEGALGWWHEGAWHELERAGRPRLDALAVCPGRDGGVWISTARRGLWRWSEGRAPERALDAGALQEPAVDLLEDRRGRLWMVTDSSGIYCLNGANLTGYRAEQGLPGRFVRCVIEDEAGQIWAADWRGGIARFQGPDWELVRQPSGHRDMVRSLVALDGALWIGTDAGGLLRFKEGHTARISVDQGLPDNCIQQLLPDGQGFLWGCTPYRLFRIPLDQLNTVMDGRQEAVLAMTYGRGDGLPETSFGDWHDPRCWRTAEGELWFATANGAIHFNPNDLGEGKSPQVLLEQVLLGGKPVRGEALQRLRPGRGRLEFQFTAPCLTAPERIRFRYQLTGVDADWVEAGTARSATYGSLPAGDHVFRVQASTPEGGWNSRPATVALSVHPYFWQSHWFFAAVVAALAGGGVWLWRRATVRRLAHRLERLRQQHAVDQERARIAQDLHDELGANLTSIGLLADMGARHKADPAVLTRDLDHISQTARESVSAMDAIVWALNPRNDSLDNFANYVAQFTRDFFRPTQVRTRLDLPANLPEQPMATETRHQLFLLVKESFNNIVRHAAATEVRLELACANGQLRLTIADNGKGLPEQAAGAGQNGLVNLRERIGRLGGALRVESQPGRGTQLDFTLPLATFRAS